MKDPCLNILKRLFVVIHFTEL